MTGQRPQKAAFVASIYGHLRAFHLPYMELLKDKGYEVHAYARNDPGKSDVEQIGVTCHDISFQRTPYQPENFTALRELTASFKQEQFQLVHLHTPVASVLGRIAARVAGISSVIYTAHGFHFFKGAPLTFWLLFYPLERLMARWTDYLIAINQEDYQRAKEFPVRKKVVYIPGVGLDLEKYSLHDGETMRADKRSELGLKENDFVIVCVAELIPRKNHIQLIKAVEQMVNLNKPVQCLLVGNGEAEEYLRNYVGRHCLEKYVHFLGFRQDVRELMALSDVVALLSRHEGLPRVVMEAMAVGKPVVATDIRGSSDLLNDGETGFLVPVDDIGAVVDAFMKLLNDPELRNRMGRNGKTQAVAYDIKNISRQMENIYDEALESINYLGSVP